MVDDDNAGLLFDYAVVHPQGFTNEQAMLDLDWPLGTFKRAARRLRLTLAGDSINLVCDSKGQRERWLYRLVGDFASARGWSANRLRDLEARLETVQAVALAIVNGTDGRSVEGRKAKLVAAVVGALREQLAAMSDQGRLWDE